MILEKFSIGIGDRFGQQGPAQLQAFVKAAREGCRVVPVWNKSHREHTIIGSKPDDVRKEAEQAVKAAGWNSPFHVDADHIGLKNVDLFIPASDFFTLDVADFIGKPAPAADVDAYLRRHGARAGTLAVPGIPEPFRVSADDIRAIAGRYLLAVKEAARTFRHIESAKGAGKFVVEVSMDETIEPQTPVEMFFILAAIADEGIPAQTIAPKFTGRFNKSVDYVGNVNRFAKEFEDDLAVIAYAVKEFALPPNLKLSVHSGSDKFSLYGPIRAALRKHNAGMHLKTAGTTWLAELEGLAAAGGDGLRIAKDVYRQALARCDEMCGPYATVIDIRPDKLPSPAVVDAWSGADYVAALRHEQSCPQFNPNVRQLLHVGYKIAAEMGAAYLDALRASRAAVSECVTDNLYRRHLKPLFLE